MTETITARDCGGTLQVTITDEFGERLAVSIPSGRLAGYPEARARGLTEAVQRVHEHVARLRPVYPAAAVVGLDALADADPETIASQRGPKR